MKNIDKIRQINEDGLSFIMMCPNEFDEIFNKNEIEDEYCNDKGCKDCIKKWLQEEYKNGYDYLD